jgi:hypothetical protein
MGDTCLSRIIFTLKARSGEEEGKGKHSIIYPHFVCVCALARSLSSLCLLTSELELAIFLRLLLNTTKST